MAISTQLKIFSKITNPVQKEAYTLVGVSLFVVLIMIFLVIRPAVSSAIEQNANNKIKKGYVEAQNEKLMALQSLLEQRSQYSKEIELLSETLPDFYDTEYVIQNFHLYDESFEDFEITKIEFENDYFVENSTQAMSIPGLKPVKMTVNTLSTFDGIKDFISFYESYPRIFSVGEISIGPSHSKLPIETKIEGIFFMKDNTFQTL